MRKLLVAAAVAALAVAAVPAGAGGVDVFLENAHGFDVFNYTASGGIAEVIVFNDDLTWGHADLPPTGPPTTSPYDLGFGLIVVCDASFTACDFGYVGGVTAPEDLLLEGGTATLTVPGFCGPLSATVTYEGTGGYGHDIAAENFGISDPNAPGGFNLTFALVELLREAQVVSGTVTSSCFAPETLLPGGFGITLEGAALVGQIYN